MNLLSVAGFVPVRVHLSDDIDTRVSTSWGVLRHLLHSPVIPLTVSVTGGHGSATFVLDAVVVEDCTFDISVGRGCMDIYSRMFQTMPGGYLQFFCRLS